MQQLDNIKSVYKKPKFYFITLVASLLIGYTMFHFTHFAQIYWNMGPFIAYTQVIAQIVLAILFGINISLLWGKLEFSAQFSAKDAHVTTIASIFGLIVSGCPACGITLASYLGLATFFSSLPFFGLELKILGVLLLLYSTNSLAKNMYVCKVNKKKEIINLH